VAENAVETKVHGLSGVMVSQEPAKMNMAAARRRNGVE